MRMIFATLFFSLLATSVFAVQQQAALPPDDGPLVPSLPNAIACRDWSAAQIAATALQSEHFLSAKELILRHKLDGQCGAAYLPADFNSPVAMANEDANISSGKPAEDGRSTLIYEIPVGHARNREGFALFIVLLP